MDRRTFLKNSAALGLTGIAANVPFAQSLAESNVDGKRIDKETVTHEFRFRNGKFKIMQITDTHYIAGDARSKRSYDTVTEIIESERPDFLIHTGDIISDGNPSHKIDAISSMKEILSVASDHQVPFAVALGNHDGQFGVSRHDIFEEIKKLPYNINRGIEGIYGDSNDIITLVSEKGRVPKWAFYLFDSGDSTSLKNIGGWSYDYVHFDQIGWYRQWSERLRKMNGDVPVPALAFMHIPVPEYIDSLHDGEGHFHRLMKGNLGEEPCPPYINSGLFPSMKEMDDVTYKRIIAAYAIGIAIRESHPHIVPAKGADDTGVTICYNSVRDTSCAMRGWEKSNVAINPVNWHTDSTVATLITEPSPLQPVTDQKKDTMNVSLDISTGLLIVKGFKAQDYVLPLIGKQGNYHSREIWLYREQLRENMTLRTSQWLKRYFQQPS